jgi:hypothetical protein
MRSHERRQVRLQGARSASRRRSGSAQLGGDGSERRRVVAGPPGRVLDEPGAHEQIDR